MIKGNLIAIADIKTGIYIVLLTVKEEKC